MTRMRSDTARPLPLGEVVTVVLDGRRSSVWWGPDGDLDRVAVREGRVRTWPTPDACADDARDLGWVGPADRCHTMLTAASVPWAFDLAPFEPRWSPADLRRLREVLNGAVHVLRTEVVRPPRAPRTT